MIDPPLPTRANSVPMIDAMIERPPMASGQQHELRVRIGGAEQHHGDRGDGVGLEQIRCHTGAVANVVANIVGDHGRVAGVILGDSGLDLPDEVGPDVGGLREDAAAEPGEDRDQRTAEGEPDEVVDRRVGRVAEPVGEHPVVARDAEQTEAHDEQACHRAGPERDVERGLQASLRRLCRAHVGAHGDVHPDEARGRRQHGADQEADRRPPAELVVEAEQEERHDRDDRDRLVLPAQIRVGAFLDGTADLLHPLVSGRLLEEPVRQCQAVRHRDPRADEREENGVILEEVH